MHRTRMDAQSLSCRNRENPALSASVGNVVARNHDVGVQGVRAGWTNAPIAIYPSHVVMRRAIQQWLL